MMRALRLAFRLLFFVAALLAAYALLALAFAAFPKHGRQHQTAIDEPPIYVCASLAHADVILSLHDPRMDWPSVFDMPEWRQLPKEAQLAIGWGDLVFFTEVPNWGDVRLGIAASALAGLNPTALRVVPVRAPVNNPDCVKLNVDKMGKAAIFVHVLRTLESDANGRPSLAHRAATGEFYFKAKGIYSPWRTCNQWVSQAMAAAGLPHAKFAPFSFSVMWPLADVE